MSDGGGDELNASSVLSTWLNRYKIDRTSPDKDPYCSASWRLNPSVIHRAKYKDEDVPKLATLLDDYDNLEVASCNVKKFVRDLLNSALSRAKDYLSGRITLEKEISAWVGQRNQSNAEINWMFNVEKAREKIGNAYPKLNGEV